jgi:hypothetical protein
MEIKNLLMVKDDLNDGNNKKKSFFFFFKLLSIQIYLNFKFLLFIFYIFIKKNLISNLRK